MDRKQFYDYLREQASEIMSQVTADLDKNLTIGDVHVGSAGGDGKKPKRKKPEPPVSVAYAPKKKKSRFAEALDKFEEADRIEAKTFDEAGSGNRTFDHFVRVAQGGFISDSAIEKLKLKIDPEELKTLLAANPALKDALASLIVGGGGAAVVGKADNWELELMRHGATHLNDNDTSVDRVRGWKNVPLSDKGKKEAAKLAAKIAKDGGLEYIASSDLKRAADTAQMVAKACGKDKVDWVTEGLRPWNVGDFAGKSSKDAVPILAKYAVEMPDTKVPGGESFNDFKSRFTKTLVTVRDKAGNKKAGIVTHHRGERLLTALESNDWNGEIDAKEFTKKGEGTAGSETMTIPMDKLRNIAAQEVTKWGNGPLNYATLWQGNEEDIAGETVVGDDIDEAVKPDSGDTEKHFALNVTKVDAEQRIFYGWAYVSEENGQIVVDKQDDYIVPADLLKAAEDFTLHGGGLGDMHDARNVGRVVASFVTTKELCDAFGLHPDNNRRGWILGFKVDDDEVWKKIKGGAQLELSIGGRGQRVEGDPPAIAAKVEPRPPNASVKVEPVTVNVSVPPAKRKTIKMSRDADGNLIADVTES